MGILIGGLYRIYQQDFFGWRFNFNFSKVEMSDFKSLAPKFSFQHPSIFQIDTDEEKRYGKGYLTGIKLKTDNRTGCDVRTGGPALDYSKLESELAGIVTNPIKDKSKDFKLIENKKEKLGGKDAFKISFSFMDPIGARVRLDQVFVSNNGENFFIICGTGEYQYEFFKKDFDIFYNSINFGEAVPERIGQWWNRLMFWKK